MTTSIFKSVRGYLILALVLASALALAAIGCDSPGDLGDACVAAESHNDCSGDMVCFQPDLCANTYCCLPPTTAGGESPSASSNPNCATGCNGGAQLICEDVQANGTSFLGVGAAEADAACKFAATMWMDAGVP
jgi:hypothetical protein